MTPEVAKIIVFFESLTPQSVDDFADFYTHDAYFKDPFNEVMGLNAVQGIFRHMYVALESPRFKVTQAVVQGEHCFLTWDFHFHFRKYNPQTSQTIRGASHLKLSPEGKIQSHRDYWDAAEELYEKLPAVGALMRWLKKKANS